MTCKPHVFRVGSLVVAIFVMLAALVATGQQTGTSKNSGRLSAIGAQRDAGAPTRALLPPLAVTTNNVATGPVTRRARKKITAGMPDQGNPLFLSAVAYGSGGTDATSVAVADLNRDGNLDLVVAAFSYGSGTGGPAGVLLGNGDGTFQPAVTYDSGGEWSSSVAVADVNRDGKLDLIVADYDSDTVGVLLGNGSGTFQLAGAYFSGGAFPKSVAVGDVNGDGKPDLVVANCGTNTCENGLIGVLLGNGDGTFQPVVIYSSGGLWANSVTVADVNADGKLDVIVANSASGTVGVLLGRGDGTFPTAVSYSSGGAGCAQTSAVAVADVNGDGHPDLVVTNACAGSGIVGVLFGNGDGSFQAAATYATGGGNPFSVAVEDLDGDGRPDLVVGNYGARTVGVLLDNGAGTFQPPLTYGAGAQSVAIADVNGDGRPDLLAAGNGSVNVLLNNTGPHVPTTTTVISSENPVQPEFTITYTATVTSDDGSSPTGTVTFQDQGTTIATVKLTGNQAACSAIYTKAGTHEITATYSGDLHDSVSTSAILTQYVEQLPIPTATVVNTSGSPSLIGQPVTFTATVTWAHGTPPDGELVTFYEGTTTLTSVPLVGGMAVYSTSSLVPGSHTIKATYTGEIRFRRSSGSVIQVVDKYPTTTTLASSLNPSIYGQGVTWTATVISSGSTMPSGTVKFIWSGYNIGSATLNSGGMATLTKSTLNADLYPLTAVYVGDAANVGSTSPVLNQVVLQTTSAATLTSSPNPSTQGQTVTLTANITSPTVTPTGPVTFTAGGKVLGTAQLGGGKATLKSSSLLVGSTTITVTYAGDSNIAKSSASVIQVVQP